MQLVINTNNKVPSERQSSDGLILDITGTVPPVEVKIDKNSQKFNSHASDDLEVRQRPMFQEIQIKNQVESEIKQKEGSEQFKKQYFKGRPFVHTDKYLVQNQKQQEQFRPEMFAQAPFKNTQKIIAEPIKEEEDRFKPQTLAQAPFNKTQQILVEAKEEDQFKPEMFHFAPFNKTYKIIVQQPPIIQQVDAKDQEGLNKGMFLQQPFNRTEKIIADQELKVEQSNQKKPENKQLVASPLNTIEKEQIKNEVPQSQNHNNDFQSDVIIEVGPQIEKQVIKTKNAQEKAEAEQELQPLAIASEQASQRVNRVIGVIILLGMFLVLWIYGWASEYRVITNSSLPVNFTSGTIFSSLFIITALFTVIGFGMLFMHFKKMSQSALFFSLFITSLTIIISPFIQKFWYNIFITDFNDTTITTANNSYLLNQSMGGKNISIDFYNLKISLLSAISQLVALLGLFGRINFIQVTFFSIFYNFCWGVNQYFAISRLNSSPDLRIFDDYQIGSVYLFGGMFGLISSLIIKKPPLSEGFLHSKFSSMFAQIGTFFIFLAFCATTILFSQKNNSSSQVRTFIWQQGFINTFFALSASVTSTYLGSILMGGKIHVRQSVIGTISGAIIFGSISQICTNIGASIACGCFSGLFSAIFYHTIYQKINRRQVFDSFGSILISIISLISTLGVAPLIVYCYYNFNFFIQTLRNDSNTANGAITNSSVITYMLQYVGITGGTGFVSGVIIGLIMKIFDRFDADKLFDDKIYFSKSSGLKAGPEKQKQQNKKVSKVREQKKRSKVSIQPPNQSQKQIVT